MKRTILVAVGMLAASVLVVTTTPADAAPRTGPGRGPVSHATGADTRSEQAAVRAFWTTNRLRAAVPRGLERPLAKSGGIPDPEQDVSALSFGSEWTVGRDTVGKVFFQMGSSLYVCSGNAVDDIEDGVTTPNLVVTAGHCVNDGGSFATNVLFIPRYDPTKPRTSGQPLGTFTATLLSTTGQWAAQGPGRFNFDVGMALVGTNENGATLANAIGGTSDIGFVSGDPGSTGGVDYTVDPHAFGYPAALPYDGTRLISCWGSTTSDTAGGSTDYRLPCNMTGGSSGGPWLLDATAVDPADPIDNSDVSDVQISVNSFGYVGEMTAMYGPIFGTTIQALYTATVPDPGPPEAPTAVQAMRGDGSAAVSWSAPADNGSPITSYTVTAAPGGGACATTGALTCTVTGLTNGTTYTVSVTATNALGTSPASESVTVTPGLPDSSAPLIRGFASSARMLDPFFHSGSTTIRVRLTDDTGITGSPTISIGPNDGDTWYDGTGWISSQAAPLSLTRGNHRDGIWTAQFSLGVFAPTGSWSAWTTVTDAAENSTSTGRGDHTVFNVVSVLGLGTPPSAPSQVVALPGNGRARVSWQGPSDSVTDYTVWLNPGVDSVTVGGGQTSAVFEGLDNDTAYTFTVVAGNDVGESPSSQASNTVTPTPAPTAPTNVTATGGNRSATVTWQPSYLSADVSAYRVTSTSSAGVQATTSVSGTATSAQLSGLANGTAYGFTVVATNAVGDSQPSAPSNQVTPAGVPDTVARPTAIRGDRSARVSWTKPSGNGSPVTGYTVTASPGGPTKTVTGGDTTTATVTGLTNGTAYTFTVVATNAIGNSVSSAPSNQVTPAAVPSRMRAPKVVVRGSKAIVKWTAAKPNGSRVTRYKVDISKGKDKTLAASARTIAFKNLKPGRYKVRIAARNAIGTGPYSTWAKFRIR